MSATILHFYPLQTVFSLRCVWDKDTDVRIKEEALTIGTAPPCTKTVSRLLDKDSVVKEIEKQRETDKQVRYLSQLLFQTSSSWWYWAVRLVPGPAMILDSAPMPSSSARQLSRGDPCLSGAIHSPPCPPGPLQKEIKHLDGKKKRKRFTIL